MHLFSQAITRFFILLLPFATFLQFSVYAKATEDKTVLLAILARDKAHVLPKYLSCIEKLDYDKKLITIYINTNNNEDTTAEILEEWARKNESEYRNIVFVHHNVAHLESSRPHAWYAQRFKVLGKIRNESMLQAKENHCDFYFVVDCDNFINPSTLKVLISKDKPIIAPLLRSIPEAYDPYSNYFCAISDNGYYKDHPDYMKILNREKVGTFKVPVVHCTYLIKSKYIDRLNYIDNTDDYEFVIFSRNARKHGVDQYICNVKEFGTLVHFHTDVTYEEEMARVNEWLAR